MFHLTKQILRKTDLFIVSWSWQCVGVSAYYYYYKYYSNYYYNSMTTLITDINNISILSIRKNVKIIYSYFGLWSSSPRDKFYFDMP